MTLLLRAPPATGRRTADDHLLTLLIVGIVLAGAALRLHGLDRTSFWNDEASSWSIARQSFGDMIQATTADIHPPLYHVILHATVRLLGNSEIALRLPSAAMGTATIYLIYRLGTVLWDRLTGVFAAGLLAFASFHLWYSQEARMYALLCLTATAFPLASLLFLRRPSKLGAALCGLMGVALFYSHVYGVLTWAAISCAIGVALLVGSHWTGSAGRTWLAIQVVVVLAFLPWIFVLVGQARQVINDFWIPFPTVRFLAAMAKSIAGGTAMLLGLLALVLIALLSPVRDGTAGLKARLATARGRGIGVRLGWREWLMLSWAVLPILAGYALSIAGRPILYDRYLIGSLPAVLLLAARGLWILRPNRLALAGAVATLVACSALPVYRAAASSMREDFRSVIATFAEQFRSSDAVVFSTPGIINTFAFYFHMPVALQSAIRHPRSDLIEWPGTTRVWVFARDSRAGQTTPLFERMESLYRKQAEFHSYGVTLDLYARAPP